MSDNAIITLVVVWLVVVFYAGGCKGGFAKLCEQPKITIKIGD